MNITKGTDRNVDAYEYQQAAMRTAKDMGSQKMNLIHAAMGMASDAGEFVDCIKKHAIYGKGLDEQNAIEEIGDVLWFCALACDTLGISIGYVMQANIDKLAKRYPDKYSDEAAIARADKVEEAWKGSEDIKKNYLLDLPVSAEMLKAAIDTETAENYNLGLTKAQQGSN